MPDREMERVLGLKQRFPLEVLQSRNTILLHLNTFFFLLKDDLFPTRSTAGSPVQHFLLSVSPVSTTPAPHFQLDYEH